MKRAAIFLIICTLIAPAGFAKIRKKPTKRMTPVAGGATLEQLDAMMARLAPTELKVDVTALSAGDQKALAKVIEASRIINDIFLTQMWSGNHAEYDALKLDQSELGKARLRYFWINKSPWSELDDYKAFLAGVPERKPLGANFYPPEMTKEQFEAWAGKLPEPQKAKATGFYWTIRANGQGGYIAVPYSAEYKSDLEQAGRLLNEAANLTDNATLRKFLASRAQAFLSNDYYQSDVDWMDLDSPLDITIGPYEVYNDELFGYKAAFEASVNIRDAQESQKLAFLAGKLQEIENDLPEDEQYRNPKLGASAPIVVVNEVFAAGDGDHGIKIAAYNLPNDDRVIAQKGSKRVMLKNVQEAKFKSTLEPIAAIALPREAQADARFDAFFTHIVAHELTHGIGPHEIKVNGRETNPRLELKEEFSAIEEAKADVTGLFALQYLFDHGELMGLGDSKDQAERRLYTTYLASAFRTLRFGITEAHGKGQAMQFNYLLDKGGFVHDPDGTFRVDFSKIKDAVRDLDHDLLTAEATGDYEGAKKLLEGAVIRPETQQTIDLMKKILVDIDPVFVTANQIAPEKTAVASKSHRRRAR